VYEGNCYKWKP